MSERPIIVTGSGRSGTHWLAHLLDRFVDAIHEPDDVDSYDGDVVVCCRQVQQLPGITERYRVMHLIRDGREVVRSQHEAHNGRRSFERCCETWAAVIDECIGLEAVRLEDLLKPRDPTPSHRLPHWTEWSDEMTETFWQICGEQMRRHGYER